MGYTHYWKLRKQPSEELFAEYIETCKKLHGALPETTDTAGGYSQDDPLIIVNGMGEAGTDPEFGPDRIAFNGNEELGHETFFIPRMADNGYCKTARKPYDLLVVACLIAAYRIFEGFTFKSDGFTDYFNEMQSVQIHECDDLLPAMNFYNEVLQPEHPVIEDELWLIREKYTKD